MLAVREELDLMPHQPAPAAAPPRSPARDQQLALERQVLASMSGRRTPGDTHWGAGRKIVVTVGIAAGAWTAMFGGLSLLFG